MCKFILIERPAFTQKGEFKLTEKENGYILQLDVDQMIASIINLKKGGNRAMVKTIRVAKEGCEEFYALALKYKENFEAEKKAAIDEAIAGVEARFADKAAQIEKFYIDASDEKEIDEPDEDVEETEATEVDVQPQVTETLY